VAVIIAACEREQQEVRSEPVAEAAPMSITLTNLYPG
jgi:hypothetical protein